MTRNKLLLSTIAAGAFATTGALAQNYNMGTEDTGLYVGGGYSFLDIESDAGDVGDNTNALTARLGWQIVPMFSLETEASFGIDDGEFDYDGDEDDFDFDDNNDGDLDDILMADGEIGVDYLIGAYGRFNYPLTDRIDLAARAGYAFIEVDSTLQTLAGNEVEIGGSESGFAYGAGAEYDFTENHVARLDYTRYEFEDSNADGVTLAYQYKF
ncbi:porin family protein [Parvularcula sp. LCG005]|uniref:porin family protein n=1 Tax=Parvularcula sp. LCG005 TaxID=3078805 RepID=UPI002943F0C3|nr:porin family protein [Parvularcula sp. LCG005]WOI53439.1 porin family protein [Parvularcula sp. LCG005]